MTPVENETGPAAYRGTPVATALIREGRPEAAVGERLGIGDVERVEKSPLDYGARRARKRPRSLWANPGRVQGGASLADVNAIPSSPPQKRTSTERPPIR